MIDDRLSVGSIIYQHVLDTVPPKNKYYIIIGFSSDSIALGSVYINTDVNPNIFKTAKMRSLHIPISVSDNPFLDYDSFIDCSSIQEKLTSIVDGCINSNDKKYGYVATLDSKTLNTVLTTLKSAPTIAPITKAKFGIL